MLHGVEGRFDAQEFAQFLPRARRLAEGEQIRCVILSCGVLCGSGNGALIIKGDDKLIAPVFKDGRGQSSLLKLPADRGNARIAVFSTGEGFGYGRKCGIAEIRARVTELIHGHAAVKCAGAVDLQPVLEEVQLDRRALGEIAVIPVDQCVQQCLADGVDRIFSPVGPRAGAGIHDGLHLHISGAEFQCSGQHFLDRAFDAFVVQKAGGILIHTADLTARDDHSGDAELGEKCLRIDGEVEHGGQCRLTAAGDVQHLVGVGAGQAGKARTLHAPLQQVAFQRVLIEL